MPARTSWIGDLFCAHDPRPWVTAVAHLLVTGNRRTNQIDRSGSRPRRMPPRPRDRQRGTVLERPRFMCSSRVGSVLVVEDDAELRGGLCDVLEEEGYSVASAVDGADALAHLSEPAMPDIVLLDLRMPNMHGYAFLECRSASQKLKEIPVIVISATPDPARMHFPIAGVLPKPVDLVALLLMMRHEVLGVAQRNDAASRGA